MKSHKDIVYFEWLDQIRESGIINMFQSPQLLRTYDPELTKIESQQIFKDWVKCFNKKRELDKLLLGENNEQT